MKRLADIQGNGTMVVGPNSYVNQVGRIYQVVKEYPIAHIKMDDLKKILEPYKVEIQKPKPTNNNNNFVNPQSQELIRRGITIPKILESIGIPSSFGNTSCPLGHESAGGKCFSFTDAVWHCFHCGRGGHIGDLIVELQVRG